MWSAASRWIYAVSFALVAVGFLVPFWPLSLLGVLLSALSGRWLFAVFIALLLDVAWGAPQGVLGYLYFPFTVAAAVAIAARYLGGAYFFDHSHPDTL